MHFISYSFLVVVVSVPVEKELHILHILHMSHLLLLGKFECGGGPIFKVVLEC